MHVNNVVEYKLFLHISITAKQLVQSLHLTMVGLYNRRWTSPLSLVSLPPRSKTCKSTELALMRSKSWIHQPSVLKGLLDFWVAKHKKPNPIKGRSQRRFLLNSGHQKRWAVLTPKCPPYWFQLRAFIDWAVFALSAPAVSWLSTYITDSRKTDSQGERVRERENKEKFWRILWHLSKSNSQFKGSWVECRSSKDNN